MSRSMINVWRSISPHHALGSSSVAVVKSPRWIAASSRNSSITAGVIENQTTYSFWQSTGRGVPTRLSGLTPGTRGVKFQDPAQLASTVACSPLTRFPPCRLTLCRRAVSGVDCRYLMGEAPSSKWPCGKVKGARQSQTGSEAFDSQERDSSSEASNGSTRIGAVNTNGLETERNGGIRIPQNANGPSSTLSDGTGTNCSTPSVGSPLGGSDADSMQQHLVVELASLEATLTELRSQLVEAEGKRATLQDRLLRSLAENENLRQRYQKELDSSRAYAISKFAESILNVADSLDMALQQLKTYDGAGSTSNTSAASEKAATGGGISAHEKSVLEGVEMTRGVLSNVLAQFDISSYNPIGEAFDPARHDALFEVPGTSKAKGTVVQVVKLGYRIKERILRPAQVGTAK